jgi:ABC-2 type transport system permease protein
MFFLSGALFPITNLPSWLSPFIFVNPVTYAVDGMRGVMLNSPTLSLTKFNVFLDFGVVCLFSIIMVLIGTYAFKKMKL